MMEELPTMPQSRSPKGPLSVFGCVPPWATSLSVRAQGVVDAVFSGGEAAQHRGLGVCALWHHGILETEKHLL